MAREITAYITYSDSHREAGGKLNAESLVVARSPATDEVPGISISLEGEGSYLTKCHLWLPMSMASALAHSISSFGDNGDIQRIEVTT